MLKSAFKDFCFGFSFFFGILTLQFSALTYADSSQEYLFEMATGYWKSQALFLAAKHNIADHLKDRPVEIKELARLLKLNSESLYRLLRTLASEGVFQEIDGKKFSLAEKGQCLRTDLPCSIRNAVVMYGSEQFRAWSNLDEALSGSEVPFDKTFGNSVFAYFKEHPETAKTFNLAMKELGTQIYPDTKLISAYPFENFKNIIDVGGGNGSFLKAILLKASKSDGILFELPEVIDGLSKLEKNKNIPVNLNLVSGDFFKEVPTGGDLYVLKRILHDWDDEQSVKILTQVRKSMKPKAKLLLIELVINQNSNQHSISSQSLPHWLDLHMMVITGGRERSDGDFSKLLQGAGFELSGIIPTDAKLSLIEGVPSPR